MRAVAWQRERVHKCFASEGCAHARIAREGHSRQERSWIVEHKEIRCPESIAVETVLIEEGASCVVVIVEEVVHETEQLDVLCHLIRAVQIDDRKSRYFGVQVI